MFEAGIRFNEYLFVKFGFDPDNGDMPVIAELIDSEGEKHVVTGVVVWDE